MNANNLSVSVRLTLSIAIALFLTLSAMIAWQNTENREAAHNQARDFAYSAHEMTLAGLTGMMITGTVAQRDVFLDQIKQLDAVRDLRVARAPAVIKQFGPGTVSDRANDSDEEEVMRTGKIIDRVESDASGDFLHIIKPAIASANYLGKNCVTCHQVPEGTVLGIVSIKISLAKVDAAIASQRLKLIIACVVICMAMFILIFLFIRHFVSRPLDAMTNGLSQIAKGEGDLAHRLPVRELDEVGRTSQAFNEMMDKFSGLVRQISDTAGQVRQSVGGLVSVAAKVSEGSREQQERSNGATKAVEAVASGVASIAATAGKVKSQSRNNLDDSRQGRESLTALIASMTTARDSVNGIVASVNQFVTSTRSITSMTREVKDIADQTNLLALNAVIEAARAGDMGRGFAVVADEVRKLAEKSGRSANEIDRVTHEIEAQSGHVMAAIEEGIAQLNRSQDSVGSVATVLERTASGVANVTIGIDAIGSATQEQQIASAEASSNIEQIAAMAKTNTDAVHSVVQSAQHLESLADGLAAAVGKFQLGSAK
ncbi:methyl-accepting chemotaxis protein [Propionivibrio sp.]|uniref:methyl-accepting chemotaxis protein n=1 Tax=Propionivibrio sp. TaxID=2212460 RepID=UPI003BF015F3